MGRIIENSKELEVLLEHEKPAMINEYYPLQVKICNPSGPTVQKGSIQCGTESSSLEYLNSNFYRNSNIHRKRRGKKRNRCFKI